MLLRVLKQCTRHIPTGMQRRTMQISKQNLMFCSSKEAAIFKPMSAAPHKLCMIPGPIEFHEDVLAVMSTPGTSHVDPAFINTFGESLELLRQVFITKDAQPFVIAGSGTLGWDMVVCNLMEPGDDVLVVNTGYFGDHFGKCAEAYGFKVTHVHAPAIGDRPSLDAIGKALEAKVSSGKPYKLINITHVDTSTGVLNDIKAISALVKAKSPSTLVSVDGVCSIGAEELRMDEWGVDVAVTASQKAIGVPSGLCIVIASQRAMNTFETRQSPVQNYFGSWSNWLPIMKAYEARKPSYFATPAVSLVMALNVSLKQLVAAGMDNRFKQHEAVSKNFKDTLESWGLKLVPVRRDVAANSMTAVYYPESLTAADLLPRLTQKGIVVAGGLHKEIAPKYFRIGHMGISAVESQRGHIQKVIDALRASFVEAGYKIKA